MPNIPEDHLFRVAMDHAFNAVVITTAELDFPGPEIVYVNPAFCKMTGYTADEVIGKTPRILQGPETDRDVLRRLRHQLENGAYFEGQAVNYRKDGSLYLLHWNISPVEDEAGKVQYFVSVQTDITARSVAERFNQQLLENLGVGVFGIDKLGNLTFLNPVALKLLEHEDSSPFIGRNSHRLFHYAHLDGSDFPEQDCPIYQVQQSGIALTAWKDTFFTRSGTPLPVEVFATPIYQISSEATGVVVVFRDISEQKRLEDQLEYQAKHDRLTGAYNRYFFDALLEKELSRAIRKDDPLSLVILDIDHFKEINDHHGHLTGDLVLKNFAELIQQRLRGADTLTRWGGEEFAILLPDTTGRGALLVAEDLRDTIARSEIAPGVHITASAGVAEYQSNETPKDWFIRMDNALYQAKKSGRNCVVFAPMPPPDNS